MSVVFILSACNNVMAEQIFVERPISTTIMRTLHEDLRAFPWPGASGLVVHRLYHPCYTFFGCRGYYDHRGYLRNIHPAEQPRDGIILKTSFSI